MYLFIKYIHLFIYCQMSWFIYLLYYIGVYLYIGHDLFVYWKVSSVVYWNMGYLFIHLINYSFIYLYIKYNYIAIMSSTSENVIVVHFWMSFRWSSSDSSLVGSVLSVFTHCCSGEKCGHSGAARSWVDQCKINIHNVLLLLHRLTPLASFP